MDYYRYSAFSLVGLEGYVDFQDNSVIEIDGLSLINIFVGANNSGKSRFLRFLMNIEEYSFRKAKSNLEEIHEQATEFTSKLKKLLDINVIHQIILSSENNHFVNTFGALDAFDLTTLDFNFISGSFQDSLAKTLDSLEKLKTNKRLFGDRQQNTKLDSEITNLFREYSPLFDALKTLLFKRCTYKRCYIPTLRNLNSFMNYKSEASKEIDIYEDRVRQTYGLSKTLKNDDSKHLVEIYTGQNMYEILKKMLLGEHHEREKIRAYEEFLAKEVFNEVTVTLIPKWNSDVLNIKLGDAADRPIYDLGDGVQALIMMTFPIFIFDHAMIFIDEPEVYLHPGMQRKLLNLFAKYTNHQYFLTTHSNHFLDLTLDFADVSIYTLKPKESDKDTKIINQVQSGDENLLMLLGAKTSSVFLSNSTIWIEGITDRLYIKKFLELYQAANHLSPIFEDIDYSFLEYGGSNITHWAFLEGSGQVNHERLCSKLMLITDNDGEKNIDRKEQLVNILGDRYKCLECLEIENILSLSHLVEVVGTFEPTAFAPPSFKEDYPHKDVKLGAFIEQDLLLGQKKRKASYAGNSGSIKDSDKLKFCRRAISSLSYANMSPIAKGLAKDIYDFVLSQRK